MPQHVSGNKEALQWDSQRSVSHSHVLPQNKWWRHLNDREDRVIHQARSKHSIGVSTIGQYFSEMIEKESETF